MPDKKLIIGEKVILETPGGSKIIELELSEEAKRGLDAGPGARLPPPSYRDYVQEGDRVRMPNGRLGTVTGYDIIAGGHAMVVSVRPDKRTGWLGFLPVFTRRFYEEEIDRLQKVWT